MSRLWGCTRDWSESDNLAPITGDSAWQSPGVEIRKEKRKMIACKQLPIHSGMEDGGEYSTDTGSVL